MFSWLRAVRSLPGWTPHDTRDLHDRLNPLVAALKKGERLIGQTRPPFGIPAHRLGAPVATPVASSGPPQIDGGAGPSPPLANSTDTSPAQEPPQAAHESLMPIELELPDEIEKEISGFEALLEFPTNIPVGLATDEFAVFFDHPLWLPTPDEDEDDGTWGLFVKMMDCHLGIDVIPKTFRRGPHGFEGLFRRWVTTSRAINGWPIPSGDLYLQSKFDSITRYIESQRIKPQPHEPSQLNITTAQPKSVTESTAGVSAPPNPSTQAPAYVDPSMMTFSGAPETRQQPVPTLDTLELPSSTNTTTSHSATAPPQPPLKTSDVEATSLCAASTDHGPSLEPRAKTPDHSPPTNPNPVISTTLSPSLGLNLGCKSHPKDLLATLKDLTHPNITGDVLPTSSSKSPTPSSPKSAPMLPINPPGGIPAGGVPIPVSEDVRTIVPKVGIWAAPDPTAFEVAKKTIGRKTIHNDDMPDIY
ncbi:uncharacterized protein MELLADRAFT_85619 [Melampsora larici-populina 98AG31]|uniref:Uncharacterized protein n=1 Tax=Melampsora larici-populina (strain 98AG31 / pathotype 3-4-7) TaxID=747676 RepID=F4SDC6_MELLP|nr:uncharacterized protein MELLADRAFT_85619 [Melampsora larici-populina 98AG31]EGF97354.1 hypothetical protein MELLADRAFT_85619 [Melampsora larici-populina 98AG31]